MKSLWHAAAMVAVGLALTGQGRAQNDNHLAGLIHHYADAPASDPWHLSGQWSAWLQGDSGKADFTAAISMVKSDNTSRQPHTHHITLTGGHVTSIPNGIRIAGMAAVTGNGAFSFNDPLTVDITGGSAVTYSNITITFSSTSGLGHFGTAPLRGVVWSE
jgi:hypothetical protein